MPIKMLKVSFDIPVEALLKAVADQNVALDIQAYQTAVDTKPAVPLLEDQSQGSLRDVILGHLRDTGKPTKVQHLREIAEGAGFTYKQLGNLLWILRVNKLISRPAPSTYKIAKRGMEY